MKRVAVIYTHFPHYRSAVFKALRASQKFEFVLFYDPRGADSTIASGTSDENDIAVRTRTLGPLFVISGVLKPLMKGRFDAVILLGNPYIVSTWYIAGLFRLLGRPVLFWTHGWLGRETGLRGAMRRIYYRLANGLLLYGNRAKLIGVELGFGEERLFPVYNSLDYDSQEKSRQEILNLHTLSSIGQPYLLCVSRLVPSVNLELAIRAVRTFNEEVASPMRLLVVGDGPLRDKLRQTAAESGVDLELSGPIYDEKALGHCFMGAVAVISPGKAGLLVMHAMAYGTPVITHDDYDTQMPESEAVQHMRTGYLFRKDDVNSLIEGIKFFADMSDSTRAVVSKDAIASIEEKYTPMKQLGFIETALQTVLGEKR